MDGVTQGKESLENFQDVKLLIGFFVCLFFVDFFMKKLELCNFLCLQSQLLSFPACVPSGGNRGACG